MMATRRRGREGARAAKGKAEEGTGWARGVVIEMAGTGTL
jgi:hypothetical protein